jgi:hypothetical protein
MSDPPGGAGPEDGRTFAPAEPLRIGPDPRPMSSGPGDWRPQIVAPSDDPLPAPAKLFEPGDVDPGPDASPGAEPTTFSLSEVTHVDPLWARDGGTGDEPDQQASEHGWILATVVLVAIFVAVAVGYTVLATPKTNNDPTPQFSTSLVPASATSTTAATTATTTTAATAPTTTAVAGQATGSTPTGQPAAWQSFAPAAGTFHSVLPGNPGSGPFPALAGSTVYSTQDLGAQFAIVDAPMTATDPAAVKAAMSQAAASVLPVGVAPPTGEPIAYPGGLWVLDFQAPYGPDTIVGRVVAANGRRFVLTMTVPTARLTEGAVVDALLRFRSGFSPTA